MPTVQVAYVLHCADLHSPVMEPEVDRNLANLISQEFESQALLEQAAGLPVTVMNTKTPLHRAAMEVGFTTFVVRPAYDALAKIAPELSVLVGRRE